jgi:hypothetical protein
VPTYQYRCERCEITFERTETISERGGEAEMPEMWEQEGLGYAGSRLRGDIKKELRAHWIAARALCGRRSRSRLAVTCALPLPSIAF